MKRPIPGGFLVAIEGIDGAGKTSISTLLAQWCGERGLACLISKEPTGLKWGTELRQSAKAGRLTLEQELHLFEMDRKDHIARAVQPALNEGSIVILDRYYWSNAAYQGARGASVKDIMENHGRFAPTPDLVLVIRVDVDAGLQRIRMRGDRPNLFEGKQALLRASQIFQQLAENQSNGVTIEGGGHLSETFNEALLAFQKAVIEKIVQSGELHRAKLDLVSTFFGGDTSGINWTTQKNLPAGIAEALERI